MIDRSLLQQVLSCSVNPWQPDDSRSYFFLSFRQGGGGLGRKFHKICQTSSHIIIWNLRFLPLPPSFRLRVSPLAFSQSVTWKKTARKNGRACLSPRTSRGHFSRLFTVLLDGLTERRTICRLSPSLTWFMFFVLCANCPSCTTSVYVIWRI